MKKPNKNTNMCVVSVKNTSQPTFSQSKTGPSWIACWEDATGSRRNLCSVWGCSKSRSPTRATLSPGLLLSPQAAVPVAAPNRSLSQNHRLCSLHRPAVVTAGTEAPYSQHLSCCCPSSRFSGGNGSELPRFPSRSCPGPFPPAPEASIPLYRATHPHHAPARTLFRTVQVLLLW